MGRTTLMQITAIQDDLADWSAKMALSLALAQAQQDADRHTARITALVSTAGIKAAGIHLSRLIPNRKLTRNELLLSAAQGELDTLAADLRATLETASAPTAYTPTASAQPTLRETFRTSYRMARQR